MESVLHLTEGDLALAGDSLDAVRAQRAELRESMAALEQALAGAAPGQIELWAERVQVALVELSSDLQAHVLLTEGSGGLHDDVVATAPRLVGRVRRLVREHGEMTRLVDDLITRTEDPLDDDGVAAVRSRALTLLGRLAHHRQAGADLLYEAYSADVGGGD